MVHARDCKFERAERKGFSRRECFFHDGQAMAWLAFFLIPFFGVLLTPAASWAQYSFGVDSRVNSDPPGLHDHATWSAGQHSIAARGDTVWLVWQDCRDGFGGVYFARSGNGGETLGPNIDVDDEAMGGLPAMALGKDGTVYVAWRDYRDHLIYTDIYFDKGVGPGPTFGPDVQVDPSGPADAVQAEPCIGVDDITGNIYVAWHDSREPDDRVYFARSVDGGISFQGSYDPNPHPAGGYRPSLAVGAEGRVYLVWQEDHMDWYEIWLGVSEDQGQSFCEPVFVGLGIYPSLCAARTGEVYVAFAGGFTYCELQVARSLNGGASFDAPVTAAAPHLGIHSLAAGAQGRVYLAWGPGGTPNGIRFCYSADSGGKFSRSLLVNDVTSVGVGWPTVAIGGGERACVAWSDRRWSSSYPDVYIDFGTSSASTVPATDPPDASGSPRPDILTINPNPFRDETTIAYYLPPVVAGQPISLRVYDIQGRLVQELFAMGSGLPGFHAARWAGTDGGSSQAASGVYLIALDVAGERFVGRVLRVR